MPVVWLIDAYRAGERSQVRALAQALGWPYEIKQLTYRKYDIITHLLPVASLNGIDKASRKSLQPPWPDLIISCGVRNEPVCRWITQQSQGLTRYVHLGRPWADPSRFDLVVTTPQYRVPERANVVHNLQTLSQVTPERLAQATEKWTNSWRELPKPLTAVIVGGHSGPFTLGPKAATRLGRQVSQLVHKNGGALLVTTSSRTSTAATMALQESLDVPHYFYRWRPDDTANPYWGILALADRFVVTADSISMLSEACATGKPVSMFDLGGMRDVDYGARDFRLGGILYQALIRWGWAPLTRDITLVHRELVAAGRVAWLGDERLPLQTQDITDTERAVQAIKSLFGEFGMAAGIKQPG